MMETKEAILPGITVEVEDCDTRLDSITNSNAGNLHPANQADSFLEEYHPTAERILRILANHKLPEGGNALLVTTGALMVPFEVIARNINPVSEKHYWDTINGKFAPTPAEIRCFRYYLDTGEFEVISLDEVKQDQEPF